MKTKHLLLILWALTFGGCGDSIPEPHSHYLYGNATDKNITIEAFSRLNQADPTDLTRDTSFVVSPGDEFELVFFGDVCSPFAFHDTSSGHVVIYSNGEKTFTQDSDSEGAKWLFQDYVYERLPELESLRQEYYKYVFTDKDFEGEPEPVK